jgi:hypothetical protein
MAALCNQHFQEICRYTSDKPQQKGQSTSCLQVLNGKFHRYIRFVVYEDKLMVLSHSISVWSNGTRAMADRHSLAQPNFNVTSSRQRQKQRRQQRGQTAIRKISAVNK